MSPHVTILAAGTRADVQPDVALALGLLGAGLDLGAGERLAADDLPRAAAQPAPRAAAGGGGVGGEGLRGGGVPQAVAG